ncbi:MAG: hypothetical protein WBA77_07215 [Microcoleaceae cyanobacterium]
MEVTQALKDTENSLRDFIGVVLERKFGADWLEHCGVTPERLDKWKQLKLVVEPKRQAGGVVEERLIYYADFYDLRTILKKHWEGEFYNAFGEWRTMEVWLKELKNLRDLDAHRRELLPHQKHLILGLAGEIRNRLIRYRSKQETSEDFYPRLESVRDSLGTMWIPKANLSRHIVNTNLNLHVGDTIDFVITASDPFGADLSYAIRTIHRSYDSGWQPSNELSIRISEKDIREMCDVNIYIKSPRPYHAYKEYDDCITFRYNVLPPKLSSKQQRSYGLCAGEFTVPDDFDAPLPDDILSAFEN